jgi:S1-C subfamily serine protease
MRPEGLALYGVSGYGAGLRDGDVLTSVAGAAATSPGAVVAAVAGAVRAKAKAISGVVWRGDERLSVTVEIPPLARLKRQPRAR